MSPKWCGRSGADRLLAHQEFMPRRDRRFHEFVLDGCIAAVDDSPHQENSRRANLSHRTFVRLRLKVQPTLQVQPNP
jgi:hypothetical protein